MRGPIRRLNWPRQLSGRERYLSWGWGKARLGRYMYTFAQSFAVAKLTRPKSRGGPTGHFSSHNSSHNYQPLACIFFSSSSHKHTSCSVSPPRPPLRRRESCITEVIAAFLSRGHCFLPVRCFVGPRPCHLRRQHSWARMAALSLRAAWPTGITCSASWQLLGSIEGLDTVCYNHGAAASLYDPSAGRHDASYRHVASTSLQRG